MRSNFGLLILAGMIACLTAACAVSEDDLSDETGAVVWDEQDEDCNASSSASTETSHTTADGTEASATPQPASCFQAWVCPKCANNVRKNVLREFCSDGSFTDIIIGPCGQPCF